MTMGVSESCQTQKVTSDIRRLWDWLLQKMHLASGVTSLCEPACNLSVCWEEHNYYLGPFFHTDIVYVDHFAITHHF